MKKHVRNTEVCIVMPGESKKKALKRLKIQSTESVNIFFTTIIGK